MRLVIVTFILLLSVSTLLAVFSENAIIDDISTGKVGNAANEGTRNPPDFFAHSAPTIGAFNNLVVFIRFADQEEFTQSAEFFEELFNSPNTESVKHFFLEESSNQLTINSFFYPTPIQGITVSYQDSHPIGYYNLYSADNPIGYETEQEFSRLDSLFVNALTFVSSMVLPEINLDANNDGLIDAISFIIHSDIYANGLMLFSPARCTTFPEENPVYIQGKKAQNYMRMLQPHASLATIAHEMSHLMGFPDLYPFSQFSDSTPVGPWDLMSQISGVPAVHHLAYMKWKYGHWFNSIPTIPMSGMHTLTAVNEDPYSCFKIESPFSTTQYYIVEYRRQSGIYESNIPGSGLIVYRIDTTANNNDFPPWNVWVYQPGPNHFEGDLYQAHFSYETGRTAINAYTNPDPALQHGLEGGLSMYGIGSAAGSTISFHLDTRDPYIWEGATSDNWNIASNWNRAAIPTPADLVVFTANCPNYPRLDYSLTCGDIHIGDGVTLSVLTGGNLSAHNVFVSSNAVLNIASGGNLTCIDLTVGSAATLCIAANGNLFVFGQTRIDGELIVSNSTSITVQGNLTIGSGGVFTYPTDAQSANMFLAGNCFFEEGSSAVIGGKVNFFGPNDQSIYCYGNVTISSALVLKTGGTLYLSSLSSAPLTFSKLAVMAGSTCSFNSSQDTIFKGDIFVEAGGYLSCLDGNQVVGFGATVAIHEPTSFFNNLISQGGNGFTLNSDIRVRKNVTINARLLAGNKTIKIAGNWTNLYLSLFNKGTSRVIFNGVNDQYLQSSVFFNILEIDKPSGNLIVNNSDFLITCNQYQCTSGTLKIDEGTVNINDLIDDGICGKYIVNSGKLNVLQDGTQHTDLNGEISIHGGEMTVTGGSGTSFWPNTANAKLVMSGGVLNFTNQGIRVQDSAYTLDLQITGGTIRTAGSFMNNRISFNFPAGIIELYGSGDTTVSSPGGGSFYDLKINKSASRSVGLRERSNKVTIAQNITVTRDFTVWSGTLALNAVTVNVGRDLYVYGVFQMNNTGAILNIGRDFVFGGSSNVEITRGTINITRNLSQAASTPLLSSTLNTINFVGTGDSNLTIMNPTVSLGNLVINKISGTVGVSTTAAALNILGNMTVSTENQFMFRTIPTVIAGALNVNGAILLQSGGSVTCYNLNMYGNISVAGELCVQHDFYQAPSTSLIILSSGNFIIDKPYTGNYQSFAGTTILNGGAITITNEGIQFGASSNLTINSGTLRIGWGLQAIVPDSFHMSTGAIEFIGTRAASIQLAEGNYLNNVISSKTGAGYVMLSSDLLLGDLMINSGSFQLLHHTLNIAGNLNIMGGTLDAAFADDLINLYGSWNNNRSPNGFTQGSGTVAFVGFNRSVIYQSEQFNNLIVNKTEIHPYGVEVETGATLSASSIDFVDGTIYLKGGSTFNSPASGFTIPYGCALYCDPVTSSIINMNGNWDDQNMAIDANQGFSSGKSVINVSGSGDRQLSSFASPLILNALNVNLSSGTCYLNNSQIQFYGNLNLQSGTLQPNMGATLECYQNISTSVGTNLNLDMGSLNLMGNVDSTLGILGTSNFYSLVINKAQATASVTLTNDWIVPAWVYVQNGVLQLATNAMSINGNVQIYAGGTLFVNEGAELRMGTSSAVDVSSGGKLFVLGTAVAPALLTSTASGYYALNINSGGSIAAEHAIFEYMDYNGVNVASGATVETAHSFNNCTFRNGSDGGLLLNINNNQTLTISGANFPTNTWFGMNNVGKYVNSGSIRFLSESGAFAGAGFENDPYQRINWNSETPSIATDLNTLSFGNVYIPMSEYRTFTITNSGSGSLTGTINIPDGFTANIYRAVKNGSKTDEPQRTSSMEFVVLAGSYIDVQVAFMPTLPQAYNSTLVITHNAGGNPVNISLTGYGIGAQVTVNPSQIIKGILPNGSHTQILSITDSGNTALSYNATIEYPTRSREVILSESFELATFPPLGWSSATVATVGTAGVWARSNGTVHPSGVAAQDGSYLAYFNSWNCSAGNQTRLQTGYLNFSAYSSISLSFWMYHDSAYSSNNDRIQVQVGHNQQWVNVGDQISRAQAPYNEWRKHTISLSAYGNINYVSIGLLAISEYGSDLNIDNIVITGSNPPTNWVFFNGQSTSVANVLAPGASDQPTVYIYTDGMDNGTYQAEIHIASNDPITPDKVVPIEISVGSPGLSVTPAAIAFGNQKLNTIATQNFSIEATGSLHLSGTITAPTGYSIQAVTRDASLSSVKESTPDRWGNSVAYLLSPGETETYQVKFSPTAIQAYSGNLSISSDLLATQTIPLSGTGANVPTLQTLAATAITSSSATFNAQISSSGGLAIYGRGFKYGTDPDPINNGNDYMVPGTNNSFSAYPTGFESWQQIYFCAFAYNEMGWTYGDVLAFVTLNPQLIVTPATQIDFGSVIINTTSAAHSFTVSGSDLSGPVGLNASAGFRISLDSGRRAERATTDQISLYPVDGELAETTIYVFFEPTAVLPYTGNVTIITAGIPEVDISLSGTGISIPTITALEATEITLSTATSGGNISDDGCSPVTERGVCWSDIPDPSLADEHSSDGTGSGIFTSSLSDLLPGTQYYVTAYATNLAGTVYSTSVTFLTLSAPVVSASKIEIESFGSIVAGEISTSQSFIVAGSGLSANLLVSAPVGFQISIDGRGRLRDYSSEISITPSSGSVFETILVRFAPSCGGEYSDSLIISSTGAANGTVLVSGIGITKPVLSTKAITSISSVSATSGGLITSEGFSGITVCGICWSLSTEPTTANFSSLQMPVAWDYSLTLSNLLPNTTYYVRAFAINAAGTAYGNELSFSTSQQALTAPTNLRITISTGTAQLNWDAVSNAVSYKIYRSLNPYTPDWGTPVATTTNPTWADAAIAEKYFYKVTASSDIAR